MGHHTMVGKVANISLSLLKISPFCFWLAVSRISQETLPLSSIPSILSGLARRLHSQIPLAKLFTTLEGGVMVGYCLNNKKLRLF